MNNYRHGEGDEFNVIVHPVDPGTDETLRELERAIREDYPLIVASLLSPYRVTFSPTGTEVAIHVDGDHCRHCELDPHYELFDEPLDGLDGEGAT